MTDHTKAPETVTTSRRLKAIPKFIGTMALLFVAWFLLTQVAPRLTMDMSDAPENTAPVSQDILKQKEAEIAALGSRIDQLEAKLKTFEEVITTSHSGTSTADERITALQEKISQLESIAINASQQNTGELKTTLANQQQDIAAIKTDMEKLKAENSSRIAAITAYTGLQDAVNKGETFAHHLTLLEELLVTRADAKDMLAALAPYAPKGLVTRQELLTSFEKAVSAALSPDTKPDSVLSNLKTLVKVRKVGTPEGSDDEAIIARAETALHTGKVEDTIQLLRELSPQAASAFAGWVQSAGQFINAQKVLESLLVLVMQPVVTQEKPPIVSEPVPPASPAPLPKEPTIDTISEEQPAAPDVAGEEPVSETEETP